MRVRRQFPKLLIVLCGSLFLQLLAAAFDLTPVGKLFATAFAEGDPGQPGFDAWGRLTVAMVNRASLRCEGAKLRAIEEAAEVSAVGDWPIAEELPAECLAVEGSGERLADAERTPLSTEEISELPPVVPVMASGYGQLPSAVQVRAPAVAGTAPPESPLPDADHPFAGQLAVVDSGTLDQVRGGFDLAGTNLTLSFGIQRAVYINGELVASTALNVKDLQLTAGGTAVGVPTGAASSALAIIQNGSGNNAVTQIAPNLSGTIIQNTLNNQEIRSVTTINASVNSLQLYRASALQSAIQAGIVGAIRH